MPNTPENCLTREQNFFEQPPFDYLEMVSVARQLELRRLRRLLPYVHIFEDLTQLSGKPDQVAHEIIESSPGSLGKCLQDATDLGITGRLKSGGSRNPLPIYEVYQRAFTEIALVLKDFPRWYEYMEEFTGAGKPWLSSGEPYKRYKWWRGEQCPPTYQRWIVKKCQREDALRTRIEKLKLATVIAETFPQAARGKSTSLVVSRQLVQRGVTSVSVLPNQPPKDRNSTA